LKWPWDEEGGTDALPRVHHWLIAGVTLFVMSHVMPLFAAFV
jgi:hypothetical protein